MQRIEIERVFEHPIDVVFRRYTDHEGWSSFAGFGRVRLVREGSPERDGVGAVRAFSAAPGLREEVTAFEAPERMEYRVVAGGFPLADHRAEVRFSPEGRGTRVTWRVSFRSRVPGLGWVLSRGIEAALRRVLAKLARDLDERRAHG